MPVLLAACSISQIMDEVAQWFDGTSMNCNACASDDRFRLAIDFKMQYDRFKATLPLDAKRQVRYGAIALCVKSGQCSLNRCTVSQLQSCIHLRLSW